jgi:nicotinamide-nucleotide amidase
MKCTILTVGTEILFGSITNTNAVYLSRQLNALGIDVMYHMTCGDNPGRLKELLAYAYEDCDMVITTGGLGPTEDDLTKENIAEFFGERNVLWEDQLEVLRKHFPGDMPKNNLKQAYFPENNCTILKNPNGTAPGFMIEKNGRIIASLPGPPKEMQPMFENELRPLLLARQDSVLRYKNIRTFGIGESQLEMELLDIIDAQTDPTLATYASSFETTLRIASKRRTAEEADAAIEETLAKVRERIGQYIYSEDGEDLGCVVLDMMRERGLRLSAAESCTGGAFGKSVTDIPGSSDVFDRSLVTYSWDAKMQELGVKRETLERFGAESDEVAMEMADGLYRASGSDVCVSVTGFAGPGGGTEDKPVGTFFVGLRYQGITRSFRFMTKRANRARVREYAAVEMMRTVYKALTGRL